MVKVTAVAPDSLGAELGLRPGTELLTIDGRDLHDFLDWEFLAAADAFLLHVRHPDGEEIEFDIERPADLPLGVAVEAARIRRCANRCDFCFVEGLPEGLRDVLYIRDDDYRLSFRYGNFATLTNLKPWDTARIKEYRLSPMYVSVHATDPALRRRLLRNPAAPDILPQLRDLHQAGIEFHTQIVVQPGVNDGEVLEASLTDLWTFGPAILSVSVVPVGLTEFSGHHKVRESTIEECRAMVAIVDRFGARARAERGDTWCYGADELYLRAGLPLPGAEIYGLFDQVENGVGAVRWLQGQIDAGGAELRGAGWGGKRIAICTGTSMGPLMPQVIAPLAEATGARFELIVLTNPLFGDSVTTAGLLPGAAFRQALAGRQDLDLALIPGEALNDDGLFMDDVSFELLQAAVPCEVRPSKTFIDALDAPVPS
jgi:putative radical SAM enzyme (TIGR03279 family)